MSIQTWIDEFYPVQASLVSKEEALEHSLLKWRGALPSNLEKHEVRKEGYLLLNEGEITPSEEMLVFVFGGNTCALCWLYQEAYGCDACPLFIATGRACHKDDSLYDYWTKSGDPIPLIQALELAKEQA